MIVEYRKLGNSGFKVPALSLGTGTFGGGNEFFKAWGNTDAKGAAHLIDVCLESGLTMFDTADIYSNGLAEEVLGQAIAGRRDEVLISTKATFRMSEKDPNDVGSSRSRVRSSDWARTTSTSSSCTASMPSLRLKRRSPRSMRW